MQRGALPDDPDGRVTEMFARAVPEIASGAVTIRALARIPGVRTKIAVESGDPVVDPVEVCVGVRGNRIERVVAELAGERIDIMPWSSSPERLIKLALAPLHIVRITLQADTNRAIVVATGVFGALPSIEARRHFISTAERQELASRISGWSVELITE